MSTARQQANELLALLRREREALAEFLVALARFDRDRGWEDLGHASLFAFLVKDLGLSNGAAAYRRAAVELVQRFPQVLEHLRSGELCITTVFELSKVITGENASEVLPRFFGTSKRDAKNVVAELAPEPAPSRTVVTAVSGGVAPSFALAAATAPAAAGRLADRVRANSEQPTQQGWDARCSAAAWPPTVVEPRTAELSRVHLTVPRRLLEKLAAARDALSHSHPNALDADVLELGLDLIIERHRKRRGIGAKPRKKEVAARLEQAADTAASAEPSGPGALPPPTRPKRSRHVPAAVWRAVWERDGGRCSWPLESGGVCGSTFQLEFDHVDGRVLCRPHQLVAARQLYGDELMDGYVGPRGGRCSEPVAPWCAPRGGCGYPPRRRTGSAAPWVRPAPRVRTHPARTRARRRESSVLACLRRSFCILTALGSTHLHWRSPCAFSEGRSSLSPSSSPPAPRQPSRRSRSAPPSP